MDLQSDETEINRRDNARELARRCGSKAAFADRIGRTPGQIGHIIGKTPTKNIGKALARDIEAAFGTGKYWLDRNHGFGNSMVVAESATGYPAPAADRAEAIELIARLSQRDRKKLIRQLTDQVSTADAAWAAALFADRVRRDVAKD